MHLVIDPTLNWCIDGLKRYQNLYPSSKLLVLGYAVPVKFVYILGRGVVVTVFECQGTLGASDK